MSRTISCGEAVRSLWEFLDHGLDEGDHEAVENHLAFCMQCCGELEFAKELRQLLRSQTAEGLPEDIHTRLDNFIEGLDHYIERHDDAGAPHD